MTFQVGKSLSGTSPIFICNQTTPLAKLLPEFFAAFVGRINPPLGPHLSHCPPDCPTSSTSASSKERKKLLLVAKWENVIGGSCSSNL